MFQRIVVPLDGSKLAEGVLPIVNQVAGGLKANVELLAVVDRDTVAINRPRADVFTGDVSREATRKAEQYLASVASQVQVSRERVRTTVTVERVATGIAKVAEAQPNTLIAMSTHGRSGIGRFVLGSVASKVLQESSVPVLLYRPRDMSTPWEKLATAVVPLDGSALAEKALGSAQEIAKALGLGVLLVRVRMTVPASLPGTGAGWDAAQVMEEDAKEVASYLAAKEKEVKAAGLKATSRPLDGNPAAAIIDLVKTTPNSLVVMSSHGRSGAGRAVLGSVADRVVANANVPVLLLRG